VNYSFKTISRAGKSLYKVKGSKHFGYAFGAADEAEIDSRLNTIRSEHHSARHVAYAWRLGADKSRVRANDDGEPGNSAGKPILGQIEKYDLTNVVVAVVRYFGGTKLGVGGLIDAYRTAAALAIENGKIVERQLLAKYRIRFGYERMSEVMLILRTSEWEVLARDFTTSCRLDIGLDPEKRAEVDHAFQAFDDIRIEFIGID
jgi:uncharacterized YigZ family protein